MLVRDAHRQLRWLAIPAAFTNEIESLDFSPGMDGDETSKDARRWPGTALIGVLVAGYCGWIAGPAAADPALLSLPTPRAGGPVVVRAGFELRDINEIDDEEETFEFEGVLALEWRDERQAFDPAAEGVNEKLYQGSVPIQRGVPGLVSPGGARERVGALREPRRSASGASRRLPQLVETVNASGQDGSRPQGLSVRPPEARGRLRGAGIRRERGRPAASGGG